MIKNILLLLLLIPIYNAQGQQDPEAIDSIAIKLAQLNDGPYVFIEEGILIEKQIINGELHARELKTGTYATKFNPDEAVFENIKKIAALSDIHGQYELAIELLKQNKIIDRDLNWRFGKGHLVIVGDIFDRGDKVNEVFWLIFKLEQQALKEGGRVHFSLGNHEYMVLHKDLRYVHEKYLLTCQLLNLEYNELYEKNTVIGRWLRSKPTIIKINNNVFVHGGISQEFLSHNEFLIENINSIMRNSIECSKEEMKSSDFYSIYYGSSGLIWYRGYFNDNLEVREIDEILDKVKTEHIVVGHCSNDEVVQLFDHRIYGVDSSIKLGEYGEMLIIKKNKYYRKTLGGKKEQFYEDFAERVEADQ